MNKEFRYYRATMKAGDSIPILAVQNGSPYHFLAKKKIENPEKLIIGFGDPMPLRPRLVDWHFESKSVVSKKIFDIINEMNIPNIQFFPAKIIDRKKNIISEDYYGLHSFDRIQCVDREKSDCEFDDGDMEEIKKIILDEEILSNIPLENRLIFRLKEDTGFQLLHSSIVDKIMELEPEGVRFVPIEEWTNKSFFE